MRLYKGFAFGFCLTLSLCLDGCLRNSSISQKLPDSEIIFQEMMNRRSYTLGFIQSDGSDYQKIVLPENFVKPFWSSDQSILYGLSNPVGQPPYEFMGYPAYWDMKNGSFKRCDRNLPYFGQIEGYDDLSSNDEVLLYNVSEIILFDMITCERKKTFVDFADRTGEYAVSGFSYLPDTQELLYGRYTVPNDTREYALIKLNIDTGEQTTLAEGINPAWSPDGEQIAYIGADGLYVIDRNGKQSKQLISEQFFDAHSAGGPALDTSQLRWSQDGNWLVYHICVDEICEIDSAEIYKVRESDGLSIKIFAGGKFPSWKP